MLAAVRAGAADPATAERWLRDLVEKYPDSAFGAEYRAAWDEAVGLGAAPER
jgi:hypothetical protein